MTGGEREWAAYRSQGDALLIESEAKMRLADEYDAAQNRGDVRAPNERTNSGVEAVGVTDIGLTHKQVHEARQIRAAEAADPGIIRRTIDERVVARQETTKAAIREASRA